MYIFCILLLSASAANALTLDNQFTPEELHGAHKFKYDYHPMANDTNILDFGHEETILEHDMDNQVYHKHVMVKERGQIRYDQEQ
jgi:hypothetical protein